MTDNFQKDKFHLNLPQDWIKNKNKCTSIIKKPKEFNIFVNQQKKNNFLKNCKNLPFFISSYSFMIFNLFFIMFCSYVLFNLFLSLRNDIRIRINEEFFNVQYLIADSKYKYKINKCDLVDIPAIRKDCMKWKRNMNKTKNDIQIMGIIMDCFGELVDRFLDQISWKFFITILCISIFYLIFYKKNKIQ